MHTTLCVMYVFILSFSPVFNVLSLPEMRLLASGVGNGAHIPIVRVTRVFEPFRRPGFRQSSERESTVGMRVSGEDAVMRSAEFDISSVAPQSPAPTSSSLSPLVFTTPQATRGPTSLSPSEPHAGSLSSQGSLFSPQAITSQEAFPATSLQPSPGSSAVHSSSQAGLSQASPQPAPQSQPERLLPFVSPSPTPHSTHSQSQEQPSQEVEMQDTMVEPMSPNLTIRVQFLTTNQVLFLPSFSCLFCACCSVSPSSNVFARSVRACRCGGPIVSCASSDPCLSWTNGNMVASWRIAMEHGPTIWY